MILSFVAICGLLIHLDNLLLEWHQMQEPVHPEVPISIVAQQPKQAFHWQWGESEAMRVVG